MPLYEYTCDDCEQEFTLLQSASVDKETTQCEHCGSSNVKYRFSSFASKVVGGTPKTQKLATLDDYPNKDIFKLPIPRHISEI